MPVTDARQRVIVDVLLHRMKRSVDRRPSPELRIIAECIISRGAGTVRSRGSNDPPPKFTWGVKNGILTTQIL